MVSSSSFKYCSISRACLTLPAACNTTTICMPAKGNGKNHKFTPGAGSMPCPDSLPVPWLQSKTGTSPWKKWRYSGSSSWPIRGSGMGPARTPRISGVGLQFPSRWLPYLLRVQYGHINAQVVNFPRYSLILNIFVRNMMIWTFGVSWRVAKGR